MTRCMDRLDSRLVKSRFLKAWCGESAKGSWWDSLLIAIGGAIGAAMKNRIKSTTRICTTSKGMSCPNSEPPSALSGFAQNSIPKRTLLPSSVFKTNSDFVGTACQHKGSKGNNANVPV